MVWPYSWLWWPCSCSSGLSLSGMTAGAGPVSSFLASFGSYWLTSPWSIIQHVFLYRSFENAPFWYVLVPRVISAVVSAHLLFALALLGFALVFRRRNLLDSALLYTLVLVIFSPAIADQYLVIAAAGLAVWPNLFYAGYVALVSFMLSDNGQELHIKAVQDSAAWHFFLNRGWLRMYDGMIILLFFGFVWMFYARQIKQILKRSVQA